MEIRPLKIEELERFGAMEQDAFVLPASWRKDWLERIKSEIDNIRVLTGDDGELKTVLRIIYPRLWLGDRTVPMAGITSVATPPEHRRQGYLKQLLVATMNELREKGYGISTLYPFYFPFYKKFGYEQVSDDQQVTVKIEQLEKFKSKMAGRWKELGAEQWEDFKAVYEQFCRGKFGMLTRDKQWWEAIFRAWKDTVYKPYLWYDAKGQPRAYVVYALEDLKEERDREVGVRDMAWTDLAAKQEALAFLANHDSQAKQVSWRSAPDDEIFALLDNPREAKIEQRPGYMLRILDVIRALTERPWPKEVKGAFTLALRDDLLEWNNLALQLEVAGGEAEVKILSDRSKAALSCDIRQLSQLYAGYLSPVKLARLGLLEAQDSAALAAAQAVFSPPGQPASYMADFF